MNQRKRLAVLVLALVFCMSGLTGCGQKETSGLSITVCIDESITPLDPIYAESVGSQTVLTHLYENLLRVAPDGLGGTAVVGGMAKEVNVEENVDGTVTYTFELRSAKWSDGEKVRARDFVYAWQRLANPSSNSPYAALLSVVCGYQEARATKDMTLLQVVAEDDQTLVVTLDGNYDWFLNEVCTSPATMPLRQDVVQELKAAGMSADGETQLRSWWADPTALVTNGPYQAVAYEKENHLKLAAGERYHGNLIGPENIDFVLGTSAEEAQAMYEAGTVDIVWPLSETRLEELAAEEEWMPVPRLCTYTVVYNCTSELLADARLRQALALCIDRNALTELAGVTATAAEGLVPIGVPENEVEDFRTVGGALLNNDPEAYRESCQQARDLLDEAGYTSGAELGALEYLYVDEGVNRRVAQELCRQWREVLGVQVTPRKADTLRELEAAMYAGEYTMAGLHLEAPGNDAECFLMDWTSDSHDNLANYENSAYDTLMAIIASAEGGTARMGCLHDAEVLLLEDYAISPLYTHGTDWEVREALTGVVRDARAWFNFASVIEKVL